MWQYKEKGTKKNKEDESEIEKINMKNKENKDWWWMIDGGGDDDDNEERWEAEKLKRYDFALRPEVTE